MGLRKKFAANEPTLDLSRDVADLERCTAANYVTKAEPAAPLWQAACAVRPAGYSDAEWLAAITDAKRLGYPPPELSPAAPPAEGTE